MNVQPMEPAPFYVLTVRGIITNDLRERLLDSIAKVSPYIAERLIICDDRTSIAPLR